MGAGLGSAAAAGAAALLLFGLVFSRGLLPLLQLACLASAAASAGVGGCDNVDVDVVGSAAEFLAPLSPSALRLDANRGGSDETGAAVAAAAAAAEAADVVVRVATPALVSTLGVFSGAVVVDASFVVVFDCSSSFFCCSSSFCWWRAKPC